MLYSSSSDVWTLKKINATGFNRMYTWMALAHAQVPVVFVGERQVERDDLDGYRVCYLSGPNLTRASAGQLRSVVEQDGTLSQSAGVTSRDEYNKPLDTLNSILPAQREKIKTLQPFLASDRYLHRLTA